jgi:hypothetical protein
MIAIIHLFVTFRLTGGPGKAGGAFLLGAPC